MRGGLDDALDKLARRDELRRRATSEATGTPAPVTELIEAVAAVVAHNPRLGVTVGVEGEGDPMVLRFYFEDGQVQVAADNALATQAGPRHADFDVEVGEPVEEAPPPYTAADFAAPEAQRFSQDNQDRYGPAPYEYDQPYHPPVPEHDTAERHYGSFEQQSQQYDLGESSRDLGARMRDLGMASSAPDAPDYAQAEPPPHPFAATPPPQVPPQVTRRIQPEQYRAPAEPAANERLYTDTSGRTERIVPPDVRLMAADHAMPTDRMMRTERIRPPQPEARVMPTPLPKPIPLQVERPEETEMAARRLAALLRDDPSLLNQRPE